MNEIEKQKKNVDKPHYKKEIAFMLGVSVTTLGRWVRNAKNELGFTFGREKILSSEKCNKILNLFL